MTPSKIAVSGRQYRFVNMLWYEIASIGTNYYGRWGTSNLGGCKFSAHNMKQSWRAGRKVSQISIVLSENFPE